VTTRNQVATRQTAKTMMGQPKLRQRSYEIQQYGQLHSVPIGMPEETLKRNVDLLNHLLADSITMHNLYKKSHWQMAGSSFYQLHLLFDKHAEEIEGTTDQLAERVQMLGGVSTGMPQEVAKLTRLEPAPTGVENIPAMLARIVEAHAVIIKATREALEITATNKDYGTNDMLASDILRMHEMQMWFISEHLVDIPMVNADAASS